MYIKASRVFVSMLLATGIVSCGGEHPLAPDEIRSGDEANPAHHNGEADSQNFDPQEEPADFEPDETDLVLRAKVGAEAVELFERHKADRAAGIEPADPTEDQTSGHDGVGVKMAALVTKRTIYGYVKDTQGRPVAGIRVTAFDSDPDADDQMGRVYTDGNGYYEMHYAGGHWDPCPHAWTCWRPDIYVAVSARRWKIEGDLHDGKPICSEVKYGWDRVAQSRTHSNWKLRNPLRADFRIAPKDQVWDEPSDKPECLQGPFCYDFSYIQTSCMVFVESLTGCYLGYEYSWKAACFGKFTAILDGQRRCFAEPLEKGGVCRGGEAPAEITPYRPGYDARCEDNVWGGCD